MENLMVLSFESNGSVSAMHRDAFSLGFLGRQRIERASEIIFDDATQKWDLHVRVGIDFVPVSEARGFEGYDEARSMEVRWFELARLHGVQPTSVEGIGILNYLRSAQPN